MTLRTWLVFLLAIASGVSAIVGVTQIHSNKVAKELTTVITVKKPIGRGYKIQEEHVEARQIPAEFAHKSMPQSLEEVIGRVATVAMYEGEYVMSNKITSVGAKAGLATLIPAGLRAYSITAASSANRVSGLINVGDKVDVLLTKSNPGGGGSDSGVSETLLQNVEVMAVDRIVDSTGANRAGGASDKNESKASTVTLMVTPKQAAVLGLGQKEGVLSLSLRNPEDQTITMSEEILEADLGDATDLSALRKISNNQGVSDSTTDGAKDSQGTVELVEEEIYPTTPAEESMTVEEMQALLSSFAEANTRPPGFTAIRTIRGSRVGVVPVRTKSK
ncbi:MAG: Flp pilus assembly protein CpaB [Pirellula sp.]|jgi:Flp pilus assembly protein CpaB